MSYLFNALNERLTGTLTTSISPPFTMGCWIKVPDYQLANRAFFSLGASVSQDTSAWIRMNNSLDNEWQAVVRDTTTRLVSRTTNRDGVWFAFISRVISATSRFCDDDTGTSAQGTASCTLSGLTLIRLGEDAAGGTDLGTDSVNRYVAEPAIWDANLGSSDVAAYLAGTAASSIAASNLRFYVPCAVNGVLDNLGLDAGGDLTVSGATWDADHPTITTPSGFSKTNRQLLLGVG